MLLILSLLLLPALAQRPSNASMCDYYATNLYGSNTTETQYKLVQSILALAFAGGTGLPNVSSEITGIFNPGTFQNISVDLLPWFNGTLDSTNINGRPTAVNWLNGGGKVPLTAFLTGQTSSIVMPNTTNEYQLFNHWIAAFGPYVFGCTAKLPLPPDPRPSLNLAYVHKYMDLNQTEVGHFIHQIALSTQYFGFSTQDSNQISTSMNARYNVRCSPPLNGQLFSICQDQECELAANPNCAAYDLNNLGPNGAISTGTLASTAAPFVPSTVSPSSSSATSTPSTTSAVSQTPQPSSSSSPIGTGSIAGIAIGGAALTFAFILALVWLLKRKNKDPPQVYDPTPSNPSYIGPSNPHSSYLSEQRLKAWNGPPIAEMEHTGSPELGRAHTPDVRAT